MSVGFDSGFAIQSVAFPPRNETFDFRQVLETIYQGQLHRGPTSTFVDIEGDIVWSQEYLRYRLSNCGHSQASQFVLLEIGGAAGPPDCGGNVAFPPRNEPFDFRTNTLEAKHRDGLHRSAGQTFVDMEGDIVWTTEYLRYRVSGCPHATAVERVTAQIFGAPPSNGCDNPPPCLFAVSPTGSTFAANAGDGLFDVSASPSDCRWTATVSVPFEESLAVRITSGASGQGNGRVTYHVDPNNANLLRTNDVVIAGLSGLSPTARHTVTQLGPTQGCTFALASPSSLSFGSGGGSGLVTLTASKATCGWFIDTGNATEDWVHINSRTLVGSSSASFTVSSASSTPVVPLPRSGPVFVFDSAGNRIFTIIVSQQ